MRSGLKPSVLVLPAALLALVGALVAWEHRPTPPGAETAGGSFKRTEPTAPAVVAQRSREAAEQCARKADEEFRKSWDSGWFNAGALSETIQFASNYNPQLDACFYLVTIAQYLPDSESPVLVQKTLIDLNEGNLYGEYAGPEDGGSLGNAVPNSCRMTEFYCASMREWNRVADLLMESAALR